MVAEPDLPLTLIPTSFDVLLKLSSDERDYMRVIVEIVQDLRSDAGVDPTPEPESDSDEDEAAAEQEIEAALRGEQKAKRVIPVQPVLELDKLDVHIRSLTLIQALLERVVRVR